MKHQLPNQNNKVIVNIWKTQINKRNRSLFFAASAASVSEFCVGHVSLETPNCYVSWWPDIKGYAHHLVSLGTNFTCGKAPSLTNKRIGIYIYQQSQFNQGKEEKKVPYALVVHPNKVEEIVDFNECASDYVRQCLANLPWPVKNEGAENQIVEVSLYKPVVDYILDNCTHISSDKQKVGGYKLVEAVNNTYHADCQSEGRLPEQSITFYSLDVDAIEKKFREVREKEYGYVLEGDKAIRKLVDDRKGQNCCGLVYECLVAGGLKTLVPRTVDGITSNLLSGYVVVTPNGLSNLLTEAKRVEETKYPETKGDDPVLDDASTAEQTIATRLGNF